MTGMESQFEARVRNDLPGALVQPLQSEIMIPDMYPGKKGAMRDLRHLIGEVATSIHAKGIDTKHLLAMELAINTPIDQLVLATLFLETYDISLHNNIHRST
jgi:hypothetical protein